MKRYLVFTFLISSCGEDASQIDANDYKKFESLVGTLSTPCQIDSDCKIVTNDFACHKSYTSILRSNDAAYQQLVANAEAAINQSGHFVGCTQEYSPHYAIENYTPSCDLVSTICTANYTGP